MSYAVCLNMSLSVPLWVCVYLSVFSPLCLSVFQCKFMNFAFFWDLLLTVNVLRFLSWFIIVCLIVRLSVYLSVCLSVSIHELFSLMRFAFVCQCHTVCLDVLLSVGLSIWLSVCLSKFMNYAFLWDLLLSVNVLHFPSQFIIVCLTVFCSVYLICRFCCKSIWLSISLSVWIPEYCFLLKFAFVCLCLTLSVSIHHCLWLSVGLSIYLSVLLSVCLSDYLSVSKFTNFALSLLELCRRK